MGKSFKKLGNNEKSLKKLGNNGEQVKEIGKQRGKVLRNWETMGKSLNVFGQGSDLELLYWEADTGKRVDWDDVSRYPLKLSN